jgi:hypothetical protein
MAKVFLTGVSTVSELIETLVGDYESYGQTDICALSLRSKELEFFDFSILPRWMKRTSPADMPLQIVLPACDIKLNNGPITGAAYARMTQDSSVLELLADEGGMRIVYTSADIELVQG